LSFSGLERKSSRQLRESVRGGLSGPRYPGRPPFSRGPPIGPVTPSAWATLQADPWAYDHGYGIGFSGG